MTIFLGSMPFNAPCDLAMTSMFRIRLLTRFSLNVICKMAESIGFPEICRPSLLSFLREILKFAVEYLCCAQCDSVSSNDRERELFICVHDHSVSARPPIASSPFLASFHLPGRQYRRCFGLCPQLWSVSQYRFHVSTAPVASPESQKHEATRMGSCQMMHCHKNAGRQREEVTSGLACLLST